MVKIIEGGVGGEIGSNLKYLGLDNMVDFFFLLYFYFLILLHSGVN